MDCAYVNVFPVWADGFNVVILRIAVTEGSRSFCVGRGGGRGEICWNGYLRFDARVEGSFFWLKD